MQFNMLIGTWWRQTYIYSLYAGFYGEIEKKEEKEAWGSRRVIYLGNYVRKSEQFLIFMGRIALGNKSP